MARLQGEEALRMAHTPASQRAAQRDARNGRDERDAGGQTGRIWLDDISKQIIEQLQQDGRRSYAAIGKAVGLSEAAVRQRVQRLLESGAMQIVAVTDPMTLGFPRQAMIGIRCNGQLEQVADELAKMEEIDYVVITAGSFDLLIELVCEDDDQLLEILGRIRALPSVTTAKRNLWLHFTRMSSYAHADVPVIVRGSGPYVFDQHGKRYLDGLSGLFVSQIGHGRREVAEAAARQASELAYFPLWSYAHPRAIELAGRLAEMAPGDLNRVFFTTSGSEAVESAWKMAKQYFKLIGQPGRYKVISRDIAYHGTSMGALAVTGLADIKAPFEPLPPGGVRVPNTNFYRAPSFVAHDLMAFGQWAADEIERAILREGPESVAAVYLEPVQNSGGCFPPPPGYFQRVREICDRYGVLLVSDEVICAFGRLGYYFGSQRYGYQPDVITFAKG